MDTTRFKEISINNIHIMKMRYNPLNIIANIKVIRRFGLIMTNTGIGNNSEKNHMIIIKIIQIATIMKIKIQVNVSMKTIGHTTIQI